MRNAFITKVVAGTLALALPALAEPTAPASPAPSTGGPWPDLAAAPLAAAPIGENDAAVIVAIERYAFVPRVKGATRNAADWYRYLTEGRKVPASRVQLLKDKQGSREAILEAVEKATREVGEGGTLWVVFIGHGAPTKEGNEGVLVGVDAQQTAVGLESRSVRQSEIRAITRTGRQAHAIELFDACFSGQDGKGESLAPGLQPLLLSASLKAATADRVVTMSAGASDEFAGPLPKSKRPAFSYLVLGALRGWGDTNGDGQVSAREAVDYAKGVLAVSPIGRTQTPQVTGFDDGLVLAKGASEPGPNLANILQQEDELDPFPDDDGMTMAQRAKRRKTFRTLGWTSVGLGAAAIGTGAFFAWQASVEGGKFNDFCPAGDCSANSSAANNAYDAAKTNSTIGNIGLYSGLGLLVVGSALIAAAPDVELPTGRLTLGPGWVSYGGDF
jgi:hypothetical protein